jgi:hypothetical protein|tara:strand:+ start:280 stop:507 length:228 start_codon:yes stop_codon:yes gene_type:complete
MLEKIELTYKSESKELETAFAVIKSLIGMTKELIKHNPENDILKKELHQLKAVKELIKDFNFYCDDLSNYYLGED